MQGKAHYTLLLNTEMCEVCDCSIRKYPMYVNVLLESVDLFSWFCASSRHCLGTWSIISKYSVCKIYPMNEIECGEKQCFVLQLFECDLPRSAEGADTP